MYACIYSYIHTYKDACRQRYTNPADVMRAGVENFDKRKIDKKSETSTDLHTSIYTYIHTSIHTDWM